MSGINKQKFLTELGRLLTFMYEEDRDRALAMYSSLFDETDDETGLLQLMVSPTRQAVNLARAYDARERKLQTMTQSRSEGQAEEEPAFVRVIEQLRAQTAELGGPAGKVSADQMSLFASAADETANSARPPVNARPVATTDSLVFTAFTVRSPSRTPDISPMYSTVYPASSAPVSITE